MARQNTQTHGPHPVDVAVGANLREIRIKRDVTQQELAAALGISFQQVQKYEKGTNRLSASKMYECAKVLKVRPEEFFTGLDMDLDAGRDYGAEKLAAKVAGRWMQLDETTQGVMFQVISALARNERTSD